jgi:hypothetical protein
LRIFGITFVADELGDPITILTKRSRANNAWVTSGDVKVRFLTKDIAVDVFHQQRDSLRASTTCAGFLTDPTGLRCPALIPPGLPKGDTEDVSLRRAFISCEDFRGLDNSGLTELLRATVHDLYETVYAEAGDQPISVPIDLVGSISMGLAEADREKTSYLLLPKLTLLYILEYTRVFKVGSPFGPHAGMDWPGLQIPQSLTSLLGNRPLLLPFVEESGRERTTFF